MNTQPTTLQLAEKMKSYSLRSGYAWHCHKAGDELHRLHEVNQELLEALKDMLDLVEGTDRYKGLLDACDGYYGFSMSSAPTREKTRAAIAKAQEQK